MKKFAAFIILLFIASSGFASEMTDTEAVEKASMNYIEGFYEGDQEKLKNCLAVDLRKHGFWRKKGSDNYSPAGEFPFTKALAYAKNVRETKSFAKPEWPKKVEVLEVSYKIAITKVTANWGIDYMLLAKNDGKWMIRQILWEGPQPTANPTDADKDGAMKTGMGYLEGFNQGDDAKLKSVLKPTMYKYGYSLDKKTNKYKAGKQMTYEKAFGFTKWARESKWKPAPGSPKKVEVLDVMNHIAAIKVTASWGIDYMLLSRTGDKWMIEHVLWSGMPAKKKA